ncbi:MAG: hypothetical protein FJX72_03045 [Armatimonadetes bacterium]|nr:hypothetical protein [Armatimonadota bacterium]
MNANARIRALRREAWEHGDYVQVALCDLALAPMLADPVPPSCDEPGVRSTLEELGIIPENITASARARDLIEQALGEVERARAEGDR